MSIPRFTFSAVFKTTLLAWALAASASLIAAEANFSATLSAEQQASTGLTTLTSEELAALDRLVAVDRLGGTGLTAARPESLPELKNNFVARRSDEERKQAGLDRLTPAQLSQLNALIAGSNLGTPKPKDRPRIKDSEVFAAPKKPEVHGGFSLTYGRGSGGSSFRSASMWVDYFDPTTGLGLSVGMTRSKGNGFYGYYPYAYDYYPYYRSGLGFGGSPYRGFDQDNWYASEERSIGATAELTSDQYRDFRRR